MRAALVGEPPGERGQAALGRRVRRLDAAAADIGRVAAHVHDHAAARVAHQRHRAAAQIPRAGEVDPDHPVPVGRVVAEDAADDVHRRVVDQDLHRTQRRGDGVHQRVDLIPVAGVQRVAGHGGRRVVGGDRRVTFSVRPGWTSVTTTHAPPAASRRATACPMP